MQNINLDQSLREDLSLREAIDGSLTRISPVEMASIVRQAAHHDESLFIIDTRSIAEFSAGHIPGSVFSGYLLGAFGPWLALALGEENLVGKPYYLVAEYAASLASIIPLLIENGITGVCLGFIEGDFASMWREEGFELEETPQCFLTDLYRVLIEQQAKKENPSVMMVVDCRTEAEYFEEYVADCIWVPLQRDALDRFVEGKLQEIHPKQVYIYCGIGYRSLIACSLLRRWLQHKPGFSRTSFINVVDGYESMKIDADFKAKFLINDGRGAAALQQFALDFANYVNKDS